jgi:hypothetical protein
MSLAGQTQGFIPGLGNIMGTKPVTEAHYLGLRHFVRARQATAYKIDFHNSGTRGRAFESPQARHFYFFSFKQFAISLGDRWTFENRQV